MENLPQHGNQDTWVTPSYSPAALRLWGKRDDIEKTPLVLQCLILEVTYINFTHMPVLVLV